jgi:hypothetical protein
MEREGLERVHGAWAHFPASVAYLAARLTDRPFSMSAHAGADLYVTRAFLAEKLRAAEFTTGCVRANVAMMRTLAGPGARVIELYHGVDLRRFDGAGRGRATEPLMLIVGRLAPAKGFDDAVRALGIVMRRGLAGRLIVVGDGPSTERCGPGPAVSRASRIAWSFRGPTARRGLVPLLRAWLLLAPSGAPNRRHGRIPNVVTKYGDGRSPAGHTRGRTGELIVPGERELSAPDPGRSRRLASLIADPQRLDAGAPARARANASSTRR